MCRKTERENWEHVIAVTNRKLTARPYLEQIERICLKRPEAVLVREKDLSEEEYGRLASEVYAICKRYEVPCIYHTFVQAAREAGAAAIHLPLPLLRKHGGKKGLPEFPVIGASVHSLEEAKEAELLGVSYLTAGHIYQTDCKKDLKPRGLGFLREVCQSVSVPVYAIGGIHMGSGQMEEVIQAGAAGGCVMSGAMRV